MIITIILSNGEEKRREKNESNYALKFGRYVKNKSNVSVETIYDFQVRCITCLARKADTFDGERISEYVTYEVPRTSYRDY